MTGPNLVGHADNQAENVLSKLTGDIDQFSDGASQQDLKRIVQRLDKNISWDNSGADATNEALGRVRGSFDTMLKDNPEYQEAMDPVAKKTALMNDIKRLFAFKKEPCEGLIPTDTTASKIKTSLNENKAITQDKLAALKDYTGTDYEALAKDYDLSRAFQPRSPSASSKLTNLGIMTGAGVGAKIMGPAGAMAGGIAGGVLGANLDAEGGVYAGKMIDWYVKHHPVSLGKYAQPLINAASQGPKSLAVTHYVLQQTHPEYQQLLNSLSEK